jgi:PhnB protein
MIADEFPEMGAVSPLTLGGTYGALTLAVEDVDSRWEQALSAGALQDAFWGERHGQIIDPFGHRWGVRRECPRSTARALADVPVSYPRRVSCL